MKIAAVQINTKIGDFEANRQKILEYTEKALSLGADIAVFPELAVCGYPPLDLLDQSAFYEKNIESVRWLQKNIPCGIAAVIGHVASNSSHSGKPYYNCAAVIKDKKIIHTQEKTLLPTYDVFDESRYFESASERKVFEYSGIKIGIAVCEDLWFQSSVGKQERYQIDPVKELLDKGSEIIISPSASPFFAGKTKDRLDLLEKISGRGGVSVVYVNSIGGNDSIVFDGNSMITDEEGNLVIQGKSFEEDICLFDTEAEYPSVPLREDYYGDIEKALITGLKDYLSKCGFTRVHLGLSGGVDSAIVAVLAVKALGRDNVKVFALPSEFSSEGSVTDADKLADNLGIKLDMIKIKPLYDKYLESLAPFFAGLPFDVAEENLQARIRGTLMMGYSNKFNSLLLTTGNKSELSTGYCTLYGDMAGGLGVIGDLFKTDVYGLCRYINKRDGEIIPSEILDKAPSAELRPDQKDEDSLPSYDLLDKILTLYILENRSKEEIVKKGFDTDTVEFIIKLVARCEYKRIQAPLVLKMSQRAFGIGRRVPLARKIYEA